MDIHGHLSTGIRLLFSGEVKNEKEHDAFLWRSFLLVIHEKSSAVLQDLEVVSLAQSFLIPVLESEKAGKHM